MLLVPLLIHPNQGNGFKFEDYEMKMKKEAITRCS